MEPSFEKWLVEQLEYRDWSVRKLAQRAGLSHTQISNVLTGKRNVTFDFCKSIAVSLGEPPEKLFRLAGLLPDLPNDPDDPNLKRLLEISRNLSASDLRDLVNYAEYRFIQGKPFDLVLHSRELTEEEFQEEVDLMIEQIKKLSPLPPEKELALRLQMQESGSFKSGIKAMEGMVRALQKKQG